MLSRHHNRENYSSEISRCHYEYKFAVINFHLFACKHFFMLFNNSRLAFSAPVGVFLPFSVLCRGPEEDEKTNSEQTFYHSLLLLNSRSRIFICRFLETEFCAQATTENDAEFSVTLWKINVKSLWLRTNYEKYVGREPTRSRNECNYFSILFSSCHWFSLSLKLLSAGINQFADLSSSTRETFIPRNESRENS